jgi:hypothetical protein
MNRRRCLSIPRLAVFAILILTFALTTPAGAADGELAKLLAKPVSPGTLAMLIPYVREPEVQERWKAALTHPDPHVRAAAARLLYAAGVVKALPDLKSALASESDPAVALELVRANLGLALGTEDAVFEAARHLSNEDLVVAIADARTEAAIP